MFALPAAWTTALSGSDARRFHAAASAVAGIPGWGVRPPMRLRSALRDRGSTLTRCVGGSRLHCAEPPAGRHHSRRRRLQNDCCHGRTCALCVQTQRRRGAAHRLAHRRGQRLPFGSGVGPDSGGIPRPAAGVGRRVRRVSLGARPYSFADSVVRVCGEKAVRPAPIPSVRRDRGSTSTCVSRPAERVVGVVRQRWRARRVQRQQGAGKPPMPGQPTPPHPYTSFFPGQLPQPAAFLNIRSPGGCGRPIRRRRCRHGRGRRPGSGMGASALSRMPERRTSPVRRSMTLYGRGRVQPWRCGC